MKKAKPFVGVEDESGVFVYDAKVVRNAVQKITKNSSYEPPIRYRLDTGSPLFNAVLGSSKYGIPYGKVIELMGPEHGGKTLVAQILMGLAQADGAAAGYGDLEESRDPVWAAKLGVLWDYVMEFYPQFNQPKKKGGLLKLQAAEQIFDEMERSMYKVFKAGAKKQVWFIDSIANIVTAKMIEAGTKAGMNEMLDRSNFLAKVLPRWAGLAANYNALVLVSNQLRDDVGGFSGFGGPTDHSTGGRALRHAAAIRCRIQRLKQLKHNGRIIGLAGQLRNIKNKAGAGSEEGREVGFKVLWDKKIADVEFIPLEELKSELFPK
jgi:recombination protein RecA